MACGGSKLARMLMIASRLAIFCESIVPPDFRKRTTPAASIQAPAPA